MQINLKLILITTIIIIMCIYGKQEYKHRQEYKKISDKIEIEHDYIAEEDSKTIETESDKEVDNKEAEKPVSIGEFKLTAYCPCSLCCGEWSHNRPNGMVYGAIGEELKEGYSIAVDPNVIPYKTEVIINGHTYKAQDCGGAIKGNRIDVYFNNHQDALNFGVQYAEVFVNM